ncbi:hypothetical protein Tco_1010385 [Tanacetum coccineum]
MEMLQARENLMEAIRDFLKKYDQIPSEEKCIALLRAISAMRLQIFKQRFDESFCEAWERFKDLLRACPHHAAGGNLFSKTPKDALTLIENKSKVHTSRNRPDALLYMPKFASTFKNLLSNKEKLFELANTSVNENCLAVILKKLPKKLGDLVGNTSRYSYNDAESINQNDVIDVAYEEYYQEVLGFSNNSESGNPTLSYEPIIANSSPSLTPFEGGDFILEEIEVYLASESVPLGIDYAEFDPEGDIHLIEEMLNKDTYSPLPSKDVKCEELKSVNSSFDEPPELKLKDLPSRLGYAFLEGTNKLPVIIAKNLKDKEKERLIKVIKSHKQAIDWKLSDIKGIDP